MLVRSLIIPAVIFIASGSLSCQWLRTKNYHVDKPSPGGVYRVNVDVRVIKEWDLAGHFTERGRLQVSKSQDIIINRKWDYRDNWDPTFMDANPSIEWVDNNVLRLGRNNAGQPFTDELMISNLTTQNVKQLGINCGKYESFEVFDIAPGARVTLNISPALNPDVSGNIKVSYVGQTENGSRLNGLLEQKQPNGPLKLQIIVSPKDLGQGNSI